MTDPRTIIRALSGIETLLEQLRRSIRDNMGSADADIANAQNALDSCRAELERELSRAQSALSSCRGSGYVDEKGRYIEPNCDHEKAVVREIEEKITQLRYLASAFESACRAYQSSAERMRSLLYREIPAANTFVRERREALEQFETAGRLSNLAPASNAAASAAPNSTIRQADSQSRQDYRFRSSGAVNSKARPFEDWRIDEGWMPFLSPEIATPEQSQALYEAVKQATTKLSYPGNTASLNKMRNYQSKLLGRINELLALKTCSAEDLNVIVPNMPVYDLKADDTYLSAKAYNIRGEAPKINSYIHALKVAIGATRAKKGKYQGLSGVDAAASRLAEVQGGSSQTLSEQMRRTGAIVIPEDHVAAVRQKLREVLPDAVAKDPARYGLELRGLSAQDKQSAIQQAVEECCERVRSSGFTSTQMIAALSRVMPVDTSKRSTDAPSEIAST